jgi:hypothetical protein
MSVQPPALGEIHEELQHPLPRSWVGLLFIQVMPLVLRQGPDKSVSLLVQSVFACPEDVIMESILLL